MKKISKIALVAISVLMLFCFAGCATVEAPVEAPAPAPVPAPAPEPEVEAPAEEPAPVVEEVAKVYPPFETVYEVAGYRFLYKANENVITLNYIDMFSAAEVKAAADALAADVNATWAVTAPGQVTFTLAEVPEQAVYDAFVAKGNAFFYDYFY